MHRQITNLEPNTLAIPDVWIVVLHWRGIEYTRACLDSISALEYRQVQVVLIDNGSLDTSMPALLREFPQVQCLVLPENLGFAGGCNKGINYCLEQGAPWIWLLNNDCKVEPNSLTLLVAQALKNPQAAALGATVHCDYQPGNGVSVGSQGKLEEITSGPGEIDFLAGKTYLRPQKNSAQHALVHCQWLSGSNLLLRAAALRQSGVFDSEYFLYFEDVELCLRLRRAGWECLFVRDARVHHAGNASTSGELSYWRAYYYTRNRLLFFSSALGHFKMIPALGSISAHLIRHLLVLPFRGSRGRKQLKAEFLGLRDYFLHRLGKATCLDWCEEI